MGTVDVDSLRSVRLLRRFMPVTADYRGPRLFVRADGVRAATPFALVVLAVLATDVVFAVDSVPAVYGITGDPFLVFATNAFALLGLRALYFVLKGALSKLVHLGYGLAAILGFIGVKLVLHWAHGIWTWVPEIRRSPRSASSSRSWRWSPPPACRRAGGPRGEGRVGRGAVAGAVGQGRGPAIGMVTVDTPACRHVIMPVAGGGRMW